MDQEAGDTQPHAEGSEPPTESSQTEHAAPQPQPQAPSGGGSPPAHQPPHRRRLKRRWIVLAGVAIAAILLVYLLGAGAIGGKNGTHGGNAKGGLPPAAITAAPARTGSINIYVVALGTVTPLHTVTVYSQITGQVTGVYYHEGQMVTEGDPLIDIDPRPSQTTLAQAQGTLDRDRGLLEEARIDLRRYQAAWARNAIPKQQLDDQEQLVVQDEGTVKADEGAVAYDQVQLSYCHIVSPITGRLGLRLVDPGNTVFSGSGSTLVVITQLQPITVVFNVSEDDLPQVESQLSGGHTLPVDAFDRSDEKKIESGTLTSLDNEVDTTTGTVKFRAEFPNRNRNLFPNQFVNARLLVKTLRRAVLVPSAAVQHNGTNAFVYVVKPDRTVAVQAITVITGNDLETAVQGVSAGTELATSGFDRLEDGAQVMIRNPGGAQNAAGGSNRAAPSGGKVQ